MKSACYGTEERKVNGSCPWTWMAVVWAENSIQKLRSPSIKIDVHLFTYYLRTVIDVAHLSLAQDTAQTYIHICCIVEFQ